MKSTTKYYKCEELFGNLEVWRSVGDSERRDIYEDVIFNLAKREKEEAKQLKKRNTKRLAQVLDTMTDVTHKTTWPEAQSLLLQHSGFAEDPELLQMDKEDALLVFENHIRQLEKDEEEEKDREKKRRKRQERKNRDAFLVSCFLCENLILQKAIFLLRFRNFVEFIGRTARTRQTHVDVALGRAVPNVVGGFEIFRHVGSGGVDALGPF